MDNNNTNTVSETAVSETRPKDYAYSQFERETFINFYDGSKTMIMETYQRKWINKILQLAKQRPEEVQIIKQTDYMVEARIPVKYLRLQAPAILSDEQKAIAIARLKKYQKVKEAGTPADEESDTVQEGVIVEAGTETVSDPKSVYLDD